jgi:hypothetical protein
MFALQVNSETTNKSPAEGAFGFGVWFNTRPRWRFSAFMTPMRASMVSPPRLHSISASIAVCHSGNVDSFFGSFVMSSAASFQREQLPAVGQNDGIPKRGRPGHAKSFPK